LCTGEKKSIEAMKGSLVDGLLVTTGVEVAGVLLMVS
jgi:hypothetical protein